MTAKTERAGGSGWRKPLSGIKSPIELARQFTPNWFATTMGTGILYIIMLMSPVQLPYQRQVAELLWMSDTGFYLLFAGLLIARLAMFPETIEPLLRHPVQSMFLGAIPMGLIPIVNANLTFGPDLFGPERAVLLSHVLWWFDAALAVGVAWLVPFYMFTHQIHAAEQITPVWLLPIVGPEVTAAAGGLLAPHLGSGAAQLVIATGYVLWAISVPLAFSIITIVFLRLALHKLPQKGMAASMWLLLGPIGTGSLGLLTLGQAAPAAFAGAPLAATALAARDLGVIGGLILWGVGFWWLVMALVLTVRYLLQGLTFSLGWWGFTFPLGVYTAATLILYRLTGFAFFEIVGTAEALLLLGIWLTVASHTMRGMWTGELFHAPCLCEEMLEPEVEAEVVKEREEFFARTAR